MRRNFADVLKEGKIDIRQEYQKLYSILHSKAFDNGTKSLYDIFDNNFSFFSFRGTCLGIKEFDKKHGFSFVYDPQEIDVDNLVSLCEYIQNMIYGLKASSSTGGFAISEIVEKIVELATEQIRIITDSIGYTSAIKDGITIFVEKSSAVIAVSESELIPKNLSYKIIEYNHHSMKGDIGRKQATLKQLADQLEAKRADLNTVDKTLTSDLFFLINTLNIRHNNVDPDSKSYKKAVADMTDDELEEWYDRTYDMCLYAFMTLEQADNKTKIKTLKDKIANSKK